MKPEPLYTCPRCKIPNFSANGLHRHNCRGLDGDSERRRLSILEISLAVQSVPATSAPAAPSAIKNSGNGGAE